MEFVKEVFTEGSYVMFKFVISGRIRRLVEAFKNKCMSGKINTERSLC